MKINSIGSYYRTNSNRVKNSNSNNLKDTQNNNNLKSYTLNNDNVSFGGGKTRNVILSSLLTLVNACSGVFSPKYADELKNTNVWIENGYIHVSVLADSIKTTALDNNGNIIDKMFYPVKNKNGSVVSSSNITYYNDLLGNKSYNTFTIAPFVTDKNFGGKIESKVDEQLQKFPSIYSNDTYGRSMIAKGFIDKENEYINFVQTAKIREKDMNTALQNFIERNNIRKFMNSEEISIMSYKNNKFNKEYTPEEFTFYVNGEAYNVKQPVNE